MAGKKVLVVDDEKLIVKGIRFSLEQDGMEVDCAYDGEEAVEKIDSAAKVKRKLAVIPEYLAKDYLCEHTAKILIGTSKKSPCPEKEAVTLIPVFIEHCRCGSDCQPPHYAERSPHNTTPAHPHTSRYAAEYCLRYVP